MKNDVRIWNSNSGCTSIEIYCTSFRVKNGSYFSKCRLIADKTSNPRLFTTKYTDKTSSNCMLEAPNAHLRSFIMNAINPCADIVDLVWVGFRIDPRTRSFCFEFDFHLFINFYFLVFFLIHPFKWHHGWKFAKCIAVKNVCSWNKSLKLLQSRS